MAEKLQNIDSSKRRLEIFYADGSAPAAERLMETKLTPESEAGFGKMFGSGFSEAFVVKTVFASTEPDGFSLLYVWFKSNYTLPAHTHDTDCLYYVISGDVYLGRKKISAGDGFFVPKETVYTYKVGENGVEILEFRGATQFDFRARDAKPEVWDRLAMVCADNIAKWKSEDPPVRNMAQRMDRIKKAAADDR